MIPVKTNTVTVTGNLDGDKISMGVHAHALQKIIGILTDLYSDPLGAVIREYSTNALDSHVASGQKRPIEVTLPSALSPYFRVKDFGLGMSVDDVREVYSQYGASTKDHSNDFNGMLGLGSKSALTYTSQFTVVANRGGVKASVVVSRAADGTGTMEVVDTVSTTEGNGVEIIIPVKYGSEFEQKARKFYSFWKPGTVLVNGKEPSLIKGNEVAPGIYSVQGLNNDYIVQGNVAYPVTDGLYSNGYYKDFGVVAYVPNGSVAFAPSREALMYDATTQAEVARIRKEFKDGLAASIQADIDMAPDHLDAMKRFQKWKGMLGSAMSSNMLYKNKVIPMSFDGRFLLFEPSAYRNQCTNRRQIDYRLLSKVVIITDFTADGMSQTHKNKVRVWADENDIDTDSYILVDKPFGAPWTTQVETYSWDDIKDTKINKNPAARQGVRGKQSYKIWDTASNWWKADDNPQPKGDVLYLSPTDKYNTDAFKVLTTLLPDAMIVMLGRNRWEKFERQFPQAKHISGTLSDIVKTYADKLTADDKTMLSMDYYTKESLRRLDPNRIDDPEVVKMIELAKGSSNSVGINYYTTVRSLASLLNKYTAEVSVSVQNPLNKYPLVPTGYNSSGKVHDHVYLYINAAYAAGI